MDRDLLDVFLLVLQLLTFKSKDYFFSAKHEMLKWDLVRQHLKNKEYTGHLSKDFICVLEQVCERKVDSC
jgi:hypothetical protein